MKKIFNRLLFSGKKRKDGDGAFFRSMTFGTTGVDVSFDAYDVDRCYVEIRYGSSASVRLGASHQAYGFLLSCVREGIVETDDEVIRKDIRDVVDMYCDLLLCCSWLLSESPAFPKAVHAAVTDYAMSLMKEARIAAEGVTGEREEADAALMSEAERIGSLPEDERLAYGRDVADRLDAAVAKAEAAEAKAKRKKKGKGGSDGAKV